MYAENKILTLNVDVCQGQLDGGTNTWDPLVFPMVPLRIFYNGRL